MRFLITLTGLLLAASLTACKRAPDQTSTPSNNPSPNAELPAVYATFYVPAYLTQRIAGDLIKVNTPIPPTEDPAFWDPTADIITRFQRAPLIIANGARFERWIDRSPLPESRLVRSADAFRDDWIQLQTTTHSHGPTGKHTHTGPDGHTWLDPANLQRQAEAIHQALIEAFPEHADRFTTNLDQLNQDIAQLTDTFNDMIADLAGVHLLAAHPSFNYPARRFGWPMDNLEPALDSTAADPAVAIEAVRTAQRAGSPSRVVVLWTAEPNASLAEAIEQATGAVSIHFDIAERPPSARDADYFTRMGDNLLRLSAAAAGKQP
ncbi:MAG: metal ABC transporter substrate-binding protein [Planctomycetota bacterium]